MSVLALLVGVAALYGCGRETPPAESSERTTSAGGAETRSLPPDYTLSPPVDPAERDSAAPRIVSAAPNVTEICCALGLRRFLVGRTRYCDHPPSVSAIPSIGALNDVNVETLLGLSPDLLLVSGASRAQTGRFDALHLRFESVPDSSLEDLPRAIKRIGELTGRERTAAKLCELIERDLAAVDARYSGRKPARVLLLTGTLSDPPRPPYVAGPGSFYDALIRRAGHVNVVAGDGAAFAPLSLEVIVRADPDVIIELDPDGTQRPGGDADALRVWAKVGALRAVAARRVRVLTGSEHYLLGPRIARTYEALCFAIANKSDN